MTTILPLELIFHIIDIGLHNDPPTLRILSFTCRAIRSYAHKHLFRVVRLRVGQRQSPNVPGFLAIIRRSPTILSAIRSLDMTLGMDLRTAHEQRIAEVDPLCSFMKKELPNLTRVHLNIHERALDGIDQMPRFRSSLSRLLGKPKLSALAVWGYGSFDLTLLENATNVVNFTIQTVRSSPNDSIVNAATQCPPGLLPTTFTLYEPHRNSVVLSSAYCDFSAVTTFRFYGLELPFQAISRYLGMFSSTLTSFEIYLTTHQTYNRPEGPAPPLNLSALFNLQHLTITFNAAFFDGQLMTHEASDFQWIINALCSLPRSNIVESIRILTRCTTLKYLRNIDWALFDSSVFGLGKPTEWPSLKALDMVFFIRDGYDLTPLVTDREFQDVWLHGTLVNFRKKTDAVLDVRRETSHSIMKYAPEDIFLL